MEEHWPRVAHLVGGGELISNESATTETSQLDMFSGIDWFIKQTRDGIPANIPMAARVQNADRGAWASHTVRSKRHGGANVTELQRRRAERSTPGCATPYYVFQIYVDKTPNWTLGETTGLFVLGGVVKESDLMAAYDAGLYTTRLNAQEHGRPVDFVVLWWSDLKANGFEVLHACGDGVSLIEGQKRLPQQGTKRKPCPGCGYFFSVTGSHRSDCTATDVSEIEARALLASVFEEN